MYEIKVPEYLDSSIIRINHWYYEEGDEVLEDTDIVELSTESGALNISSPVAGVLDIAYFDVNETVHAGDVIGIIVDGESADYNYLEEKDEND